MDFGLPKEWNLGLHTNKMTSIIINSFYRALCKINDYEEIKTMDLKKLATLLMDELYPEDGYVTLEDNPRGNFRIHMNDQFMDRMRTEVSNGLSVAEAIETTGLKPEEPVKQEASIPVAAEPAVVVAAIKEVKTKAAPKSKMTEEEKAEAKAAKEAEKAAAKEAEKAAKVAAKEAEKAAKAAQPKAKFVGNLEKLNPTQEKLWKKVAAEAKVDLTDDHKKRFLAEMNALDNKVYNLKKMEAHMAEFFAPKEKVKTQDQEMWEIEFEGKTYYVSDDGGVYEPSTLEDGTVINKKVGSVGMAKFKDMEQPKD